MLTTAAQFEVSYQPPSEKLLFAEFVQRTEAHFPFVAHDWKGTDKDIDLNGLLPAGVRATRFYRNRYGDTLFAVGHEMVVMLDFTKKSNVHAHIAATDIDTATAALKEILAKVPNQETDDDTVRMSMWRQTAQGDPVSKYKVISTPSWAESEVNYPPGVTTKISELVKLNKPENAGKIILWHGEPGTGKTSAIRALAREWKMWCGIHYISDPEKMFQNPHYLTEVGSGDEKGWRLVIAEDTDEFLRVSARHEAGAALGRLLNFSDGILGQGCNTIFLLTTNEKLTELHPAITRPGRCLAQVEFRKFQPAEAKAWLGEGFQTPPDPKTLAELIELRKTDKQISTGIEYEPVGNYL